MGKEGTEKTLEIMAVILPNLARHKPEDSKICGKQDNPKEIHVKIYH